VLYNISDVEKIYEINFQSNPAQLFRMERFVHTGYPMLSRSDVGIDDMFKQ